MKLLETMIAWASPETALKREHARRKLTILNSGYSQHGASYSKKSLLGWITTGADADRDIADNIRTLRNRSRDLYMGTPIATSAIKTIRTGVVTSGLMLLPTPDFEYLGMTEEQAEKLRADILREWEMWAETQDCDAARMCTFYQLQSLALVSALMSGDVFVTMPIIPRTGSAYDLRVSLIEADRVCDPTPKPIDKNIVEGVEVDKYGAPVAYWIAKNHPGAIPRTIKDSQQEWKRVPTFGAATGRRNVLHIMSDMERPGQRRGVPVLAPVMEALKQLGRYTDAELMAAVVSGMYTVFIKSTTPETPLGSMFPEQMEVDPDPNAYELGNGAIVSLGENESIETANPGRPNTAFDGFVSSICRQIGAALEIPHEILLKEFTASYSASRGALLEAFKVYKRIRENFVASFCQPVYAEWFSEAVAKGRISAPGFFDDPAIRAAYVRADWVPDSHGQLDPLKEVNAAKVRVDEGFSTREREAAELTGMRFYDIVTQRSMEEQKRKAAGLIQENTTPNNNAAGGEKDNGEVLESDNEQ